MVKTKNLAEIPAKKEKKEKVKTLLPLVMMQLKDKFDFNYKASFKATLFKIVFALIKFILITAIIYIAFSLLSTLRLIDLNQGIPDKFLGVIFTIMILLSVLTCTIGLTKSLYYAKDNQLLLTMPTNRVNIFFSKLIVYYIYEFIRNITFILPILIAFGMVNGYAIIYYLWVIIAMFWLTGIIVSLGALLSIPAMLLSNFFRNFKPLQYIVIVALLAGGIYLVVSLINLIPENFDIVESWGTISKEIKIFMNNFKAWFLPIYFLLESIVGMRYGMIHKMFYGEQWLCLLGVFGAIVVLLGICYLVVRPLFFKIASSPFEYKKSYKLLNKKYLKKPSILSGLVKETKLILRNSTKMYTLIGMAIAMPIAILLLNRIFNAMDTKLTGKYMTIMFNMLMIMLFSLSSSTPLAHVYSEEGNSSYLMKTNPQPYFKSLIVKLLPNAIVMTLSILATVIIYKDFGGEFMNPVYMFLAIEGFYLGHLLWSAELDFMHPQNAQYASTGTHTNNPNEVKSTVYMFLLSVLVAFLTIFLIGEGVTKFWFKIALLGIIFFIIRFYFYCIKIKVYYKEK